MKLEDVLEVLPMLMTKIFVDWFIFIWGHEQCSKIVSQNSPRSYYYLKDLKRVYYGCWGLPYGKENQTLLIDDEPSNTTRKVPFFDWSLRLFSSRRRHLQLKVV